VAAVDSDVFAAFDAGAQVLLYRPATRRFSEEQLNGSMDLDHADRFVAKSDNGPDCLGDLARSRTDLRRSRLVIRSFEECANHATEPF
jgi:hypothetical protein